MPRIYTSANDVLDFCKRHLPSEGAALARYAGLGPAPISCINCFAWNAVHPPYDDGVDYKCAECGRVLTGKDN